MSVDETKIDLSKPYGELEGQGADNSALGADQQQAPATPAVEPQVQPPADPATSSEPDGSQQDTGDQGSANIDPNASPAGQDNTVPYRRFKKFHDEALQARQEAEEWKRRFEQAQTGYQPQMQSQETSDDLPAYWIRLWGDNEMSREAWKAQQEMNRELIAAARTESLTELQKMQSQEETRYQENLAALDDNLDLLGDYLGRRLTATEEDAILDIIDEYTPKDNNGNYAGAILPVDKAWEIYELKQNKAKAPVSQARDQVASLTGQQSQGDTSVSTDDEKFVSGDWGAWRRSL